MHEHMLKHPHKYLGLAVFLKVMLVGLLAIPVLQVIQSVYAGSLPYIVSTSITCPDPVLKTTNTMLNITYNTMIETLTPTSNFTIEWTEYAIAPDGTTTVRMNLLDHLVDGDRNLDIARNTTLNGINDSDPHTVGFTIDCHPNIDISVTAGAGWTITPSWTVSINGKRTFTITPDAWYIVEQVTEDGTPVTPTPTTSYTYDSASRASTVQVTFKMSATGWGGRTKDKCWLDSTLNRANFLWQDRSASAYDRKCWTAEEEALSCKNIIECLWLKAKVEALQKVNSELWTLRETYLK